MKTIFDVPAQRTARHDDLEVVHSAPQPHDLPKLSPAALRAAQEETLAAARRDYSLAARALFVTMDLLYGRRRTLAKFRVLEVVARVPYQSWETATYKQISRSSGRPAAVLRLWDRVRAFRAQQDNEQWHLMLLTELCELTGATGGRLRHGLLPKLISFGWWHFCWLLYALSPRWSHRLNADFEDHAEHQYAAFVAENPHLDDMPHVSEQCTGYGSFACVGDLLRQIGHDERLHKRESEARLVQARA